MSVTWAYLAHKWFLISFSLELSSPIEENNNNNNPDLPAGVLLIYIYKYNFWIFWAYLRISGFDPVLDPVI